ncbi:MAG: alpha-L-fucosidase, partial [Ruthenibacterium sp.]
GIVVNPRLHGDGDFETCEVKEASQRPNGWWEFCTQWQSKGWAYLKDVPYRSLAVITTEFVRTLAWGGNYLLNVGPMADGSFSPETMRAIEEFTVWHQALCGTVPLSNPALCEVPAVEKNGKIYIFLLPENNGDIVLTALSEHVRAAFLDDGSLCASARTGEGKLVLKTKGKADTRAVRTLEVIL